jgi:hypothetical protein
MHVVALGRGHEFANLIQTFRRQPAPSPSALNGKAISRFLVWTAELMAALMCVDPQLQRLSFDRS